MYKYLNFPKRIALVKALTTCRRSRGFASAGRLNQISEYVKATELLGQKKFALASE